MTVRSRSRSARPARNITAVGQRHSQRAHTISTPRDRAAVIQRANRARAADAVTIRRGDATTVGQRAYRPTAADARAIRGFNPGVSVVFKLGNSTGPHRGLRAALNSATARIVKAGDRVRAIVQAIGRALNRPAVIDTGRRGASRAGQGNPRASFAFNHRPGTVDQTLNKAHTNTVRAALNLAASAWF